MFPLFSSVAWPDPEARRLCLWDLRTVHRKFLQPLMLAPLRLRRRKVPSYNHISRAIECRGLPIFSSVVVLVVVFYWLGCWSLLERRNRNFLKHESAGAKGEGKVVRKLRYLVATVSCLMFPTAPIFHFIIPRLFLPKSFPIHNVQLQVPTCSTNATLLRLAKGSHWKTTKEGVSFYSSSTSYTYSPTKNEPKIKNSFPHHTRTRSRRGRRLTPTLPRSNRSILSR